MPASVTIIPEKEWPTSTVGPSCRASTFSAEATASGSVVSGFCTEVTFSPAACNRGTTSDQEEPSANSPCTSTTLRAFGGVAFAAMPRVEISEAAAPASRAVENVRLSIMVSLLCASVVWVGGAVNLTARDNRAGSIGAVQQGIDIGRSDNGAVAHE